MTRRSLSVALAAVLSLGGLATSAQAALALTFNPTGSGNPADNRTVDTFDQLPGNAIAVNFNKAGPGPTGFRLPAVGETFQLVYEAANGNLLSNNVPVYSYGLSANNQLTWVATITEAVTAIGAGGFGTASFLATGGTLQAYYNAPRSYNDANGTNFNTGTLVYSGAINTGADLAFNSGSFTSLTPPGGNVGPLDQSVGGDRYPAIKTIGGSGGTNLEFTTTFANPNFFVAGVPSTLSFLLADLHTQNNLPFRAVAPTSVFYNGQAGATLASVGPINGGTDALGNPLAPNVMFESDASTTFQVAAPVPEPSTIISASMAGVAGLFYALRRRRARTA